MSLNYLQVPVLAVYSFQGGATTTIRPFVAAGPVLALKLGANISDGDESESISDDVTGADFGFVIGGGIERGPLSFEGRYFVGLKDVDKGSDITKNRVFSILVGYRFGSS